MKVLVMSDSHGFLSNAKFVLDKNPEIKFVIHLGDYYSDAVKLSEMYKNIRFEFVSGNCDGNRGLCSEKTLEVENTKIFITHGHNYSVKWNYRTILERAKLEDANIILFGHTHIATIDRLDNIILLNPGSISQSRSNQSESYAILDIRGNKIKTDIFYI